MAVQMSVHSGKCCGIRVHWGFVNVHTASMAVDIASVKFNIRLSGRLHEVVLTDEQCCRNNSYYVKELKKLGFKRVSRFRNRNSGNICNVFHYHRPIERDKIPYDDTGPTN